VRRSRRLGKLEGALGRRLYRLQNISAGIARSFTPDANRAAGFVVIEAQNAWANFCREYYLSCVLLRPHTLAGSVVLHGASALNTERDALLFSIRHLNPNQKSRALRASGSLARYEPAWHQRNCLLRLSLHLSTTNQTQIQNALSYPTTFFSDMPVVRNFYCHRNISTYSRVKNMATRNYGMRDIKHPVFLVNEMSIGGTQTILCEWLQDMRAIANTCCQ